MKSDIKQKTIFMATYALLGNQKKRNPFLAIRIVGDNIIALQLQSEYYDSQKEYEKWYKNKPDQYIKNTRPQPLVSLHYSSYHKDPIKKLMISEKSGLIQPAGSEIEELMLFNLNDIDQHQFEILGLCSQKEWNHYNNIIENHNWNDQLVQTCVHDWVSN